MRGGINPPRQWGSITGHHTQVRRPGHIDSAYDVERAGLRPHGDHDGIGGIARFEEKGGGGGKDGDRLSMLVVIREGSSSGG